MKNVNINLDLYTNSNRVISLAPVNIKGQSTVNFILTGVDESTSDVIFLDINWGDSTEVISHRRDTVYDYKNQSILNEVLYGKIGGSLCTFYSHPYFNNTKYNIVQYDLSFTFYYDNGIIATINQPLRIHWGSFYDEIKELVAINTQIVPLSTNYTFVNLESKENVQIIPAILGISNTTTFINLSNIVEY